MTDVVFCKTHLCILGDCLHLCYEMKVDIQLLSVSDEPEAVCSRTRQLPNFRGEARQRQAIPRTRRGSKNKK